MHSLISLINRNKNTVISIIAMLLVSLSTMYLFWNEELNKQHKASIVHFQAVAKGKTIEWKKLIEETSEDQSAFVLDQDAKIIHFNHDHLKEMGYSEPEVLNQEFFPFIHPEDLPELMVSFIKGLQGGEKLANVGPYRFKTKAEEGKNYRYFIATITPVKDKSGKVTQLVVVQKDITYGITPEKPAAPEIEHPPIRDLEDHDPDRRILVDLIK